MFIARSPELCPKNKEAKNDAFTDLNVGEICDVVQPLKQFTTV